jgi:AcrR family transcriptional regulator
LGKPELRAQEAKSLATQHKIFQAVTACLVELGYADTSINRVIERAKVSKGALQHHFPIKEDLMAATVLWLLNNASLERTQKVVQKKSERSSAKELTYQWRKIVNTDEYRALLEILITMRTDKKLKSRVAPQLKAWHAKNTRIARDSYQAVSGNEDDVDILMALHGCVIRGLLILEEYTDNPGFIEQIIERWIEMIAPLLSPREVKSAQQLN